MIGSNPVIIALCYAMLCYAMLCGALCQNFGALCFNLYVVYQKMKGLIMAVEAIRNYSVGLNQNTSQLKVLQQIKKLMKKNQMQQNI